MGPLNGQVVLIVDSDAEARALLAEALLAAGAIVEPVATAHDGCLLLEPRDVAFAALVCDLREARDGHWALVEELRRLAQAHRIPALAVTSLATVEDRDQALARGFDDYASKADTVVVDHLSRLVARSS